MALISSNLAPLPSGSTPAFLTKSSSVSLPMVSSTIKSSETSSSSARLSSRSFRHVEYAVLTIFSTSTSILICVASDAICGAPNPLPCDDSHAVAPSSSLANPHCVTMLRARLATCWKSPEAPVVISSMPYRSSSATRPPSATTRRDSRYLLVYMPLSCCSSEGKNKVNPPAPLLRGTMVTLDTSSNPSMRAPTMAWPHSW
mmetsp:Transcript_84859/g.164574  ORF Transcript_84859/g.164574 Transcript_84859/m.164574 type:complete len:201 (+) Transcript_84859:97-699(+)